MLWRREWSWQPREPGWWVPALFLVGSFLFAAGSFPPYAQLVDSRVVGVTFFVGSLFFTAAAYAQFVETINTGSDARVRGRLRWTAWQPRRALWWATTVQLAGTLLFNRSTVDARGSVGPIPNGGQPFSTASARSSSCSPRSPR